MNTIINGVEIIDNWIKSESEYYIKRSVDGPAFKVWFSSRTSTWNISVYYYYIQIAFNSFYNEKYYSVDFSSADEAKQYVDNFINKYNKLKVFL